MIVGGFCQLYMKTVNSVAFSRNIDFFIVNWRFSNLFFVGSKQLNPTHKVSSFCLDLSDKICKEMFFDLFYFYLQFKSNL